MMEGKLLCLVALFAAVLAAPKPFQDGGKAQWMKSGQETLKNALAMTFNKGVAKNVILFLGDGLGVSTVTAARIYKGQKAGQSGEETQLNFEKFPHVALSKTYNTDYQTADSAGTATAFLCGVKGNYGTLGVDSRIVRRSCELINNTDTHTPSILDWSRDAGKSTGIVTNTRLTHATPGASYAHTPDRDWEKDSDVPANCPGLKDVAYQLLKVADINVMLGGGRREFYNRKDGRSLPEEWLAAKREAGKTAEYVQNGVDFRAVDPAKTDYLLGIFSESHMSYEVSRNDSKEPSLREMTVKAIEILQKNRNKGFFLLVEGGRIDHGHHDNFAKIALEETIMFDNAVQAAKDMTGGDTLIIVTADHSHVFNIAGYSSRGNDILGIADRPDEEILDGLPYATLVYANGPGHNRTQNLSAVTNMRDDYFRSQRLVPFGIEGESHSGEDVAIFATGPMSHLFHGVHEQNYIAHVMGYAACVGPNKDHCNGGTSGTDRKSYSLLTIAVLAVALRFVLAG